MLEFLMIARSVPFTIVMYVFLLLTILLGVMKFQPAMKRIKIHKALAVITLVLATFHGVVNLLIHFGVI